MRNLVTLLATICLLCSPLAASREQAAIGSGALSSYPKPVESAEAAEISQAESAQAMIQLTWIQIIISVIGTIGLIATLTLNRKAIRQTDQNIALADFTARQELRAYLDIRFDEPEAAFADSIEDPSEGEAGDRFDPSTKAEKTIRLYFKVRNQGQTPARNITFAIGWQTMAAGPFTFTPPPLPPGQIQLRDIPPNSEDTCFIGSTADKRDALLDAFNAIDGRVCIWIRLEFDDIFKERHWVEYSAFLAGNPPFVERHNPGFMGGS